MKLSFCNHCFLIFLVSVHNNGGAYHTVLIILFHKNNRKTELLCSVSASQDRNQPILITASTTLSVIYDIRRQERTQQIQKVAATFQRHYDALIVAATSHWRCQNATVADCWTDYIPRIILKAQLASHFTENASILHDRDKIGINKYTSKDLIKISMNK